MSPRIALVISGGGAKGAYAAGAVKYLATQGCTNFDVYTGTSTGALVSTLTLARGFDELEIRYTTGSIPDYLQPLDLEGIKQHLGLVDSRGFRQTLEQVYSAPRAAAVFDPAAPQLILTAVQLRTGMLAYFHTGSGPGDPRWTEPWETWHAFEMANATVPPREQLLQVLQASGSEPIKFPPVKLWLDGDWYVDGGVRAYTPIKAALAAGADELFIIMHSPRNGNVTVARDQVDSFLGVVGQTLTLLLANASSMDFAQAHALANGVEIENRIVAPREPIVGVGSGPNTLTRRIFNQGFTDAAQVWQPLLQQRPDLATQLRGGAPQPRAIARGLPPARRPRGAAKVGDAELVAFWAPPKPVRRRRAKTGAKGKRRSPRRKTGTKRTRR
jgi:predicted acylesterase/phospholipase RssA